MATITRPRYTETHCGKGHELTPENTLIRKCGGKRCAVCVRRGVKDSKYGRGAADYYDQKLLEQDGVCAICGGTDPNRALSLDHDHETNEWRGRLCTFCNLMVGWVEKDRERITMVENYLNGGWLS